MKQVRFAGSHSDIGDSHKLDKDGSLLADNSRRSFYRVKERYHRPLKSFSIPPLIHQSVKTRFLNDERYRPPKLVAYLDENGWPDQIDPTI